MARHRSVRFADRVQIEDRVGLDIVELELDVTDAVPVGERCVVSGTLFIPEELPARPVVVVAVPGGTYNRRYYDLDPPGFTGYSQARYFAEHGVLFAALDYLSGGDSSRPADGDSLTIEVLAAAAHAAFERLRDGLAAGSFGGTPIADATFVGLGWSFGGCLTIVQQGTYDDYSALAIIGYSPVSLDNHAGTDLPANWDELSHEQRRDVVRANNQAIVGGELPMYHGNTRRSEAAQSIYYVPGTPEELIAYDEQHLHTLVARSAGIDVMTPGFARPFAEKISRPVFLGFGDIDIVATPRAEPRAYPGSRHITVAVFPEMAHVYNFAATRQQLWDSLLVWSDGLDNAVH